MNHIVRRRIWQDWVEVREKCTRMHDILPPAASGCHAKMYTNVVVNVSHDFTGLDEQASPGWIGCTRPNITFGRDTSLLLYVAWYNITM